MSLPMVDRFVEFAAAQTGKSYIWAGKGDYRIDSSGNVVALDSPGFDCSGLVTCALHAAGFNDHRNDWNAQAMFDTLSTALPRPNLALAFFGQGMKDIHHVCICLEGDVTGWVIEAAGGDQRTLTPQDGARVFFHRVAFWGPAACQGYRALPVVTT
jgi:hypothetical protein